MRTYEFSDHQPGFAGQNIAYAIATFTAAILIGYVTLRFFDVPVRKWLQQKLGNV